MSDGLFVFVPILLFLIIFPLFWSAIVFLVSLISGWRKLAGDYKHNERIKDGVLTWKSGYMRFFSRYSNVLHVKGTHEGLYLATNILYRAGHPPLLIPWENIASAETATMLFVKTVQLHVGTKYSNTDTMRVTIYGKGVFEHLLPYLHQHRLISAETTS